MNLIEQIDEIIDQINQKEKELEDCRKELVPKLLRLATELCNEKERQEIIKTCADLSSTLDRFSELNKNYSRLDRNQKEELDDKERKILLIIYDIKSGDILKRRRQKSSERIEDNKTKSPHSEVKVIEENPRTSKSDELIRSQIEDIKESIRFAREHFPHASTAEIYEIAKEFRAAASREDRIKEVPARHEEGAETHH